MELYLTESGFKTELDYGVLDISGDEQNGYRPFQLMVASIAGCSGSVFKQILDKQRVEIEDISISADVKRNTEEANRIEQIILTINVKGHNLNQEKLERNLNLSRKNCPMVQSVKDSIKIEEKLNIIE